MEEKILSILLNMQEDISGLKETVGVVQEDVKGLKETQAVMQEDIKGLKETQAVMQEDIKDLKENQAVMQEDIKDLKKNQYRMQKAQDKMNVEIHEIRFELSGMKEVQEEILEELRVSNLKQGQIIENLSRLEEENAKEHKEFDTRIRRLEAKAV